MSFTKFLYYHCCICIDCSPGLVSEFVLRLFVRCTCTHRYNICLFHFTIVCLATIKLGEGCLFASGGMENFVNNVM